jgi:hypothetical protein
MKKLATLLTCLVLNAPVFAQVNWNKKLPTPSPNIPTAFSRIQDGDILLFSAGQIIRLDKQGVVTGRGGNINSSVPIRLSNYLQKRTNSQGKPYFLTGWRSYPTDSKYNLSYYLPDKGGWQSTLSFGTGEFGNISSRGPAVLELTDTSLLVFTRSFVRKIACPNDTCWIEWEKPLTMAALSFPNAAVIDNDEVYFVTTKGEVSAVNSDGLQLWIKLHDGFIFRGVVLAEDGLVACGSSTNGNAVIVKLTLNGDIAWEKSYSEDIEFNAITTNPDGSIIVTGQSNTGNISLLKTDMDGNQFWRNTFQKGHGATVIPTPDSGFFLTGGIQNDFFAIKTNSLGEAPVVGDPFLFRTRNLKTEGFSLTQQASSSLFYKGDSNDFDGTTTHFFLPSDSTTTTIYAHSPWLAGIDQTGSLHVSASETETNTVSDFRAGMISSPKEDFDRVWKITREEIASFQKDIWDNGVLDSPISFDFLTWPAKGNPNFIQNLYFTSVGTNPDSLPAPFVDINNDGIYNAFDGDYPKIKGDQMLWFVFTDEVEHAFSDGIPLKVDISVALYGYNCPQNEALSSTLFAEYTMINRSPQSYPDAYFGFYSDLDIGCPWDDYIGTLPETNTIYAYNSDILDDTSNCLTYPTYGEIPPIAAVTMLNRSLDHTLYHSGFLLDPISSTTIYNSLRAIWPDGTPQTIGGYGYNPGSTNFTNFALFGNPSDSQGWSHCAMNTPLADRKMTPSHGPFTLEVGDTFNIQLAFTFHPDIPHPCPDVETWVNPTIQQIQQWHDDGTLNIPLNLDPVQILQPGQSLTLDATVSTGTAYVWSTGATTSSIVVNQVGLYTVTVTRASGCEIVETVLVKLASGTSNPTLPSWTLQPNPANDVLKIVFENAQKPFTTLLYNAQGTIGWHKNR